ncbi:[acyl-carrier-protein] S-malonyltransferase [Actinobacteria bacterium YIM 96077]|uniref:Malonyl CoA-acyl carrier protein transacylase n=1 Tax=Phytoactinopolyspora halophila TaxID=1981511 RepID=A0A329QD82_9ACTN|nr:ACP S-malonyltransferase [Phytoactinopolyspora halophila]AYY14160.1 [acyl-carrier-protein] S-malonyltransferase [Actinobacteria bacterium YIM 96077]RAW10247.1 [acyl-carrier-protein] S-malonyltransferase [Phytoactinopolyspora halophila]
MIGVLFPGQGAQFKGMGAEEFARHPELVEQANEILGYSIEELCTNDPDGKLGQTQYTQVALYVVNALQYLTWHADGNRADYLAGHSVGEYDALFAAGAFDFSTGLELVKRRGELMSSVGGGGMAAVMSLSEDQVRNVLTKNGLEAVDVANLNTPQQTVISGRREDIDAAEEHFTQEGAWYVKLNVSGPFHSRYMSDAAKEFGEYITQYSFKPLQVPVISNLKARPYSDEEIAQTLIDQICSPVKWSESVRYMMGKGVETFTQVGPGRVAKDMANQITRLAEPLVVGD